MPLRQRRRRRPAARQGVYEDPVVAAVHHIHDRAVRPDAARVTVVRIQLKLLRLVAHAVGHAVGEDLVVVVVGHPHRRAVRPDAVRGLVAMAVERKILSAVTAETLTVTVAAVVGQDIVVPGETVLHHPDRVVVCPDASGVVVTADKIEIAVVVDRSVRESVGVDLVVVVVNHIHGRAVGPDAGGIAVAGDVQLELAASSASAAPAPVGIDPVVGAGIILSHPDELVVSP